MCSDIPPASCSSSSPATLHLALCLKLFSSNYFSKTFAAMGVKRQQNISNAAIISYCNFPHRIAGDSCSAPDVSVCVAVPAGARSVAALSMF